MNIKVRRISLAFVGVILAALLVSMPSMALEMRSGDEVVIDSSEVIDDDLYVGANIITVNGTIKGDLVAAGATITINGVVEGDLLASGQHIVISGDIGDDARVAAAAITLKSSGAIGDDLVAAGYSLETEPGSEIDGSLLFTGGQALLAGSVQENVEVRAGSVALNGQVGGDADIDVGGGATFNYMAFMPGMPPLPEVPGGLTVEGAEVDGQLRYSSPGEVELPDNIDAEYVHPDTTAVPGPSLVDRGLNVVRQFVSLLLVGLIMTFLTTGFTNAIVGKFHSRMWQSLVVGLIALFGAFAVLLIFLLMILLLLVVLTQLTLGALAAIAGIVSLVILAAAILVLLIISFWISRVVIAVWLGRLIFSRISPKLAESRIWPLVLGLVIIVLLMAIPILGFVVSFVIALAGLGAVALWGLQEHDRRLVASTKELG
ncbi:MAG: polymer-forming cytoskeletal protein [Caldilineales bacterium]|nr:polymer-forming cytoskeletal protein [Caldilineales bacterium]